MAQNQPRSAGKKSADKARRRAERQEVKEQTVRQPLDLEWKNATQENAWNTIQKNHVTFLLGSAGSGKTFIAMAYAINAVLTGQAEKIVLTRPIVEAGERLGFLPGDAAQKINPYMQPLYDALDKLTGKQSAKREFVNKAVVLAPLCYMRGRTFENSIVVLDEAQNATRTQLKLILTRFGHGSKFIVTGDPTQSDLPISPAPLKDTVARLQPAKDKGVGFVTFANSDVVRHPIVSTMLELL